MIISVASGKGGTGKTTVATNLAFSLAVQEKVQYLDCDVEEPNGHIFLKPHYTGMKTVNIYVPSIDEKKCTCCGKCAELCQFNALAVLNENVIVFPELCHGCGACWHFCPEKAVKSVPREIGVIETGVAGKVEFIHGKLNVGVAMSPPVIDAVKGLINPSKVAVVDAPPGTSCPVIEAVDKSNFCILVSEPTPFGLNDLTLAVEMLRTLEIPFGVVINKAGTDDAGTGAGVNAAANDAQENICITGMKGIENYAGVEDYCSREGIPVLLKIPYNRRVMSLYSRGELPARELPEWRDAFKRLYRKVRELAAQ